MSAAPQATDSASSAAAAAGTTEKVSIAFDGGIEHEGSMDAMSAEKDAALWYPSAPLCATGTTSTAALVANTTAAGGTNGSAPAADPASTFPRRWSGTYTGTSSYVDTPDHHITRAVAFDITSMSPNGNFEGTCYVGSYESGPDETYGTCGISGDVAWDTGEVRIWGTYWIDQGGLGDLREYSGYVNFSTWRMEDTAWDVGTGLYETPWSVSAVDTIYINQNGSTRTIG